MYGLAGAIEGILVWGVNGLKDRRAPSKPLVSHIPEGVRLGTTCSLSDENDESETTYLSTPERRKHLYVLGATGSGKTNLLVQLIDSDVQSGRSVVVIDLRGDLVDRILKRLAAHNDTVATENLCLIDLRDDSQVVGFNPLLGCGEIHSRAFQVLGVLRSQAESWGVQLEETMRNALVALTEAELSLLEIEPLLTNPEFRASVLSKGSDPYVRSFFVRFDALSPERQLTWALPVLNKVTPLLAIPRIRLMLGASESLDVAKLMNEKPGQILLISLAVDRLHQAAYLLGGLVVSAIQNAAMARTDTPEQNHIPVSLYIDEFETMASDAFSAIVAEGRRFGLSLTLSHQNLTQVPAGLRSVLRNNIHTQFFFQTGAQDASELSAEVSSELPREVVRSKLLSLQVGEAFLVRRGDETVHLRTAHSPDPKTRSCLIEDLKAASHARNARPRAVVEREIALRLLEAVNSNVSENKPEVRHGKRPHVD